MLELDLVKLMVTNIPNFMFSGICTLILYRINNRLMDMLDRELIDKAKDTRSSPVD